MDKGGFISIEGIEGSGKSTQVKLLANKLQQLNYDVVSTREPGGTEIGERIRHLLLDPVHRLMDDRTEILLYAADRAQDVSQVIRPALEQGKIVLADRYIDSNIAYQGYGRKLDLNMVQRINEWVIRDIWPDLTIILDIDVETGLKRARDLTEDRTGDRLEREVIAFHRRVRDAYRKMAGKEDGRFVIVDAGLKPETIHQRVLKIVKERLNL